MDNLSSQNKGCTSNGEIDFTDLLLPEFQLGTPIVHKKRETKKTRYVRIIPLEWLDRANRLPGCVLQVGMCVWYYWGLESGKSGGKVVFSPSKWEERGLNKSQVRRGLKYLEEARLIEVERSGQHSPKVKPVWGADI
jgi:hypothetical protein